MRVRWTPKSVEDMQRISDYLAQHVPHYRQPTLQKLYYGLRALKNAPFSGRPGQEDGTRELLFLPMPYVAVYRVREEIIHILRIFHTSQHRPGTSSPTEPGVH